MKSDMIRSRVKIWIWLYLLFLLGGVAFAVYGLTVSIREVFILGIVIMSYVLLGVSLVLREITYITINKTKKEITWYSIFTPLGKRANLSDYTGLIKSQEYTSTGPRTTVHLVDHNMFTRGKISSVGYYNFDELIAATNLPEIKKYDFGVWKYLQLLFTGRIKIKDKKRKK